MRMLSASIYLWFLEEIPHLDRVMTRKRILLPSSADCTAVGL